MEETRVNGTQEEAMDGAGSERDRNHSEEALDDDSPADEGYGGDSGGDAPDMEKLRQLRLSGFLRELVRAEGRMESAELLGVAYRTLVKAEESGEITGRMGDALERLAGTGDDPEVARLRQLFGVLEERMQALEVGLEGLRSADQMAASAGTEKPPHVQGEAEAVGEPMPDAGTAAGDGAEVQAQEGGGEGAGRSETRAAPPGDAPRPRRRRIRRSDPEVVTVHPAEDDVDVYGAAWPLVKEWRKLRAGHPNRGSSLSWLTTHVRVLELELSMLEEHGLTLPPETQALRGFARRGQTSWRWTALAETRTALRKRKLLRWVRRILTLGLWRK